MTPAIDYLCPLIFKGNATKDLCDRRGCCWNASNTPRCFYPSGFGYEVIGSVKTTDYGYQADLRFKSDQSSPYGDATENIRVDVVFETQNRLRVKVGVTAECVRARRYHDENGIGTMEMICVAVFYALLCTATAC